MTKFTFLSFLYMLSTLNSLDNVLIQVNSWSHISFGRTIRSMEKLSYRWIKCWFRYWIIWYEGDHEQRMNFPNWRCPFQKNIGTEKKSFILNWNQLFLSLRSAPVCMFWRLRDGRWRTYDWRRYVFVVPLWPIWNLMLRSLRTSCPVILLLICRDMISIRTLRQYLWYQACPTKNSTLDMQQEICVWSSFINTNNCV